MFVSNNINDKYLLLLKADEFLRDRAIVAALRNYDGMVVGMHKNPAAAPHRLFDYVINADPHNKDDALNGVKKLESEVGLVPEFVVPITEMSLQTSFSIASEYNLPSLEAETVLAARDKDKMKKCFYDSNISTPKHHVFSSLSELKDVASNMSWPIIIKPVSAAHSVGIMRIDSASELESAYQLCSSDLEGVSSDWSIENSVFQAEEYIDADKEISVEVYNEGDEHVVIAVTDKSLTPPPFFAETGHMVPSVESNNQAVLDLAINSCKALGITMGISHVEIRIDKTGTPYVIEVAARPGGDGIMDLVERAHAVNLYDLHIKSYMGLTKNVPHDIKQMGTAAVSFITASEGTIRGINYNTKLSDEIVSLYISASVGDELSDSHNYDDRLGTVEMFWNGNVSPELSNKHLEIADHLSRSIFDISN